MHTRVVHFINENTIICTYYEKNNTFMIKEKDKWIKPSVFFIFYFIKPFSKRNVLATFSGCSCSSSTL